MNSFQDLLVNSITVLSTQESTNSCTGAVVVHGGVGIKGNLYVDGTINSCPSAYTSTSTPCNPKTITFNETSVTEAEADGSGLIINIGSCLTRHFLWYNGSGCQNKGFELDDCVTIKGSLHVTGTITSDCTTSSDTSSDTTCSTSSTNIFNSDILPLCTNTYNIGSSSKNWKNIYLSENIYLGIGSSTFFQVDSCNKMTTIGANSDKTNENKMSLGNTLNLFHSSCTNQDAYLLRLIHDTPNTAGCNIQFDIGNTHCCEIGANNSDNKEFNVSISGTNKKQLIVKSDKILISNNLDINENIEVQKDIKYNQNLIHSTDIFDNSTTIVDTSHTFTEIDIAVEQKFISFSYNKCHLQPGHIKYFIVTKTTFNNCNCNSGSHYEISVNDLIGGSKIILSSIGQSIGLIWTSEEKWLCFCGIACIIT